MPYRLGKLDLSEMGVFAPPDAIFEFHRGQD